MLMKVFLILTVCCSCCSQVFSKKYDIGDRGETDSHQSPRISGDNDFESRAETNEKFHANSSAFQFMQLLKRGFQNEKKAVREKADKMERSFTEVKREVSGQAEDLTTVKKDVAELKDVLATVNRESVEEMKESLNKIKEDLSGQLSELLVTVKRNISEQVIGALVTVNRSVTDQTEKVSNSFKSFRDNSVSKQNEIIKEIGARYNSVTSQVSESKRKLTELYNFVKQKFSDINNSITKINQKHSQLLNSTFQANLWMYYKSSYYWFSSTAVSFDAARAFCQSLGAYLVRVTSSGENEFLKNHVKRVIKQNTWIGAKRYSWSFSEMWMHGGDFVNFGFDDWAPGEPSRGNEYCAEYFGYLSYRWNDRPCDDSNAFICEKDY